MFGNPFDWLRRKAAESVVLGTADGLRAVAPEGETPPADIAELRALLAASVQTPRQLAAVKAEEAVAEPAKPVKGGRAK